MNTPENTPTAGVSRDLAPGLRVVLAPNPSPMTYWGTNTYLLGTTEVAVIDPGPESSAHLQAILDAVPQGGRISHIFVTHAHLDHSPLSRALSRETGAPVYAYGTATRGRSAVMRDLAARGFLGGGEGIDADFAPDIVMEDGDIVSAEGWQIEALHTPGHIGNHLCFAWQDALFCGDHVMGWASSLVSPPDGDLSDFMASCHRLRKRDWQVFYSGHGAPIDAPAERLDWLISHRGGREKEILLALQDGAATATDLAARLYTDISPRLLPAASRNVFAHLIDLTSKNRVTSEGPLTFDAAFRLI